MELRRSEGHDVHLDAVDRVHLAVGGRGRGLLLELALLVAGHFVVASARCAGRSAVSVAAPLPMREHRAGPVSRAAVALASAFSVLGDCLRVDQKTRRPTARPVARFGHTSAVACAPPPPLRTSKNSRYGKHQRSLFQQVERVPKRRNLRKRSTPHTRKAEL